MSASADEERELGDLVAPLRPLLEGVKFLHAPEVAARNLEVKGQGRPLGTLNVSFDWHEELYETSVAEPDDSLDDVDSMGDGEGAE
jgi:hypothetical protein